MARTRSLKPSFFTNEKLADLEPLARLLFQGLWLHADKEGRLEDRPRKLRAEILPYDNVDGDALLAQLEAAGFIERYSVNDAQYISIPTFLKHQKPHPKEPTSVIPPRLVITQSAPRRGRGATKPCTDHDSARSDHVDSVASSALPSSPSLPSNTLGEETPSGVLPGKPDVPSLAAQAKEVFTHWIGVMNHPQAIFGPKRERAVLGRLKQGFSVARLKLAIEGCKKSPFHQGGNPEHAIHDDLELICRDEKQVEKFLGFYERPQGVNGNGNGRVVGEAAPVANKYSGVGVRSNAGKN